MFSGALCASSSVRLAILSVFGLLLANTRINMKRKLASPCFFNRQHMIVTALAVGSF